MKNDLEMSGESVDHRPPIPEQTVTVMILSHRHYIEYLQ